MNVLAFVLIGLQLRPILEPLELKCGRATSTSRARSLATGDARMRIAWVMTYNVFSKLKARLRRIQPAAARCCRRPRAARCSCRGAACAASSTLAAALALPTGGRDDRAPGGMLAAIDGVPGAFPYRDLIVLTAFSVVIGTLVIQGLDAEAAPEAPQTPG